MSLKQPLLSNKNTKVQNVDEEYEEEEGDSIYYEDSPNTNRTQFQYTLQGVQRKDPLPVVIDKKSSASEGDYLLGKPSSSGSTPSYMTNVNNVHNASDALQQVLNFRNSFVSKQQQILKDIETYVSSLKSEIVQLQDKNKALETELNDAKKNQKFGCGKKQILCAVALVLPLLLIVIIFIVLIVIFGKDIFCKVQS